MSTKASTQGTIIIGEGINSRAMLMHRLADGIHWKVFRHRVEFLSALKKSDTGRKEIWCAKHTHPNLFYHHFVHSFFTQTQSSIHFFLLWKSWCTNAHWPSSAHLSSWTRPSPERTWLMAKAQHCSFEMSPVVSYNLSVQPVMFFKGHDWLKTSQAKDHEKGVCLLLLFLEESAKMQYLVTSASFLDFPFASPWLC